MAMKAPWCLCIAWIASLGCSVSAFAQPERRLQTANSPGIERRLALVVGNDGYAEAKLRNARNDARAMAGSLQRVGFEVTLLEDAGRESMAAGMAAFGESLQPTDVALFYFAGHGVQVGSENFLIPVDFAGRTAADIRLNTLRASEIQQLLQAARVSLIVLDACRNNPFAGTRGTGGLAPMEAHGSLVAFSTGAGQVASDGDESNGVFTGALVKIMETPGLSIQEVFQRVRRTVFDQTGGRQMPALYDGLLGEFSFRPRPSPDGPVPQGTDASTNVAELALWEAVKDSNSPVLFRDYLRRYPDGLFAAVARERIARLDLPDSKTVAVSESTTSGLTVPASDSSSSPPSSLSPNTLGLGWVYVYRVYRLNQTMLNPIVMCDGEQLARLRKGRFFRIALAAGEHRCSLKGGAASKDNSLVIRVAQGTTQFLAYHGGATTNPPPELQPVDVQTGLASILKLSPSEKGEVLSPDRVTSIRPVP